MGSSLASYIMLLDDMGDILKVLSRSDMNKLRKSYSPGWWGLVLVKFKEWSKPFKRKKSDIIYRKEREQFFIRKFNTFYKGLNKMP